MKICFFSHGSQTNQDGATLSMINIIEELTRRGHSIVAVMAYDRNIEELKKNPKVKVLFIPSYNMRISLNLSGKKTWLKYSAKNMINNVYWIHRVYKAIRDEHIDIIHINGLNNGIGAVVAKKLGIPYVWHIRQLMEEDLSQSLFNHKQVYPLVSDADCVIGISNVVKEKFEPIFGREIRVVYNGVPIDEYCLANHEILENEQVNLLLAGRVAEGKGHMEAVMAMEILAQKEKNVRLIFVGHNQGHFGDAIKDYVETHKLNDRVTFLEHVADLRELRSTCDIGLLCSKKEAFGRVTIETQLANMLFIGTNTGATPEIIHDGFDGLLYEQGNCVDLADKIIWAIHHRNTSKRIAAEGYKNAKENYSIGHVVEQLEEIYKKINRRGHNEGCSGKAKL